MCLFLAVDHDACDLAMKSTVKSRGADQLSSAILVVDDHDLFRFSIRRMLLALCPASQVLSASSAAEGIVLAARYRPRICLLDYQMPMLDGLQAIPRIIAESPATRILLMSLEASAAMADRAEAAGAAGLIDKCSLGDDLDLAIACTQNAGFFRSASVM